MKQTFTIERTLLEQHQGGTYQEAMYRRLLLSAMEDADVETVCLVLVDPADVPHKVYDHPYYTHRVVRNDEVTEEPLVNDFALQITLHNSVFCQDPTRILQA